MRTTTANLVLGLLFVVVGLALGAAGIYVGDSDDAPGAGLLGLALMVGAVALGVRTARRRTT